MRDACDATVAELEREVIELKCELADHFLHNYDEEIHDGTMRDIVRKLDRVESLLEQAKGH